MALIYGYAAKVIDADYCVIGSVDSDLAVAAVYRYIALLVSVELYRCRVFDNVFEVFPNLGTLVYIHASLRHVKRSAVVLGYEGCG